MKKILFVLLAMCAGSVYAQDRFFDHTAVELRDALSLPLGSYHGGDSKPQMAGGADFWYSFDNLPWDCGLFTQFDVAKRRFEGGSQKNESASFGVLGCYNFHKGEEVNPFVSVGVGASYHDTSGYEFLHTSEWSGALTMRSGVEICGELRVGVHIQVSRKGYNTWGLNIGWVMGRRMKK